MFLKSTFAHLADVFLHICSEDTTKQMRVKGLAQGLNSMTCWNLNSQPSEL